MNKLIPVISSAVLCCAISGVLVLLPLAAAGDENAKKPDGKAIFDQKCLKCHKVEKFKELQHDRKGWEIVLSRMERSKSCILSDEENAAVAEYLSKKYGE